MTERTARETVDQAISDFNAIREAIRDQRVEVPYPTPTSEYAELIGKINSGFIKGKNRITLKSGFIGETIGKSTQFSDAFLIEPIAGVSVMADSIAS